MIVLGLHFGHDAGASVLRDGIVISAIERERISRVKHAGKPVSEDLMRSVLGFLALFVLLFALSTAILAGLGVDLMTAIGAAATSIGNVGPGFGAVGPADNFAHFPILGKWVLIVCMLLGRLEIYTLIVLIVPEFWRK